MAAAAGSGFSTATDLADWLVREPGLPFREAHHVTGRAVALAEQRRLELEAVAGRDAGGRSGITGDVFGVLGSRTRSQPHELRRHGAGQCAPQIAYWRARLPALRQMIFDAEPAMTEAR